MFGWFRKYVKKVGLFGVEVEFHPQTEPSRLVVEPPQASGPPPPPAVAAAPMAPARLPQTVATATRTLGAVDSDKLAADRASFLDQIEEFETRAARDAYEKVVDDLIAWSEDQGGQLRFSPRAAKNSQATVAYEFRGKVFWDVWPQKKKPSKFTYEFNFEREYLVGEFAKLSADRRPASPALPTVALRDLVSDSARQRLKDLLSEVLQRLARS